jgi:probable phosphoglycerate mutase
MKIVILRHADPDYEHDSLTEKGFKEAKLLGDYFHQTFPNIKAFYVSPLGRAQRTFEAVKKYYPEVPVHHCDWLVEFRGKIHRPDQGGRLMACWDLLPEDAQKNPMIYTSDWLNAPLLNEEGCTVRKYAMEEIAEFDKILAIHGYVRNGLFYEVKESNHDVIVFCCHFGIGALLASHLMHCSPYSLWEHTCLLPSSVTVFASEERRQGIAHFRAYQYGSTAHLSLGGEEASFSGRFAEVFTDSERHD